MKTAQIRVVLVDDHPLMREGTRSMLKDQQDMAVVGVADSGAAVLELLARRPADVLVLDLRLPDASGVEVARRVRTDCPDIAVLILTGYEDVMYVQALRRFGVRGYLRKTASGAELAAAIRVVASGGTVFEPELLEETDGGPRQLERLTERELEVLRLLAAGRRNAEVADELVVSVKTVEFHVSNVLEKLGARSRTEALSVARRVGLLPP